MQRPNLGEFLRSVLENVDDLPDGLAERLEKLVDAPPPDDEADRAARIQRLIEESTR